MTVTADPGEVRDVETASARVNLIGSTELEQRATAVVAQAAAEEPGLALQRTSPSIAGVFVRGLTGNKVNVFLDGMRYSTSAMRGGISTFLSLVDPASVEELEVLRGPTGVQYGSDGLGGTLSFISQPASFFDGGLRTSGRFSTYGNTANHSLSSSLLLALSSRKISFLSDLAERRLNPLRPGGGFDSHSAVTRFFGLPSSSFIGERMPDTGFTQYGGMSRLAWRLTPTSQLSASYHRSQQDGGKRFDQLLGGDGNLIADLRNLMLDFATVRYERDRLGWLDQFTAAYSVNSQREERVNQGGNGNPRASISHEYERTTVHGLQAAGGRSLPHGQRLWIGGEFYGEQVSAPSFAYNPATGIFSLRRGRVPDGAAYRNGGAYVHDVLQAASGKLRLEGSVRYSAVSYSAHALDSPLVAGKPLWPDDSLSAGSTTFRAGLAVTPLAALTFSANVSSGFRAPHITDLGTLGLTGSGFEVAAPDLAGMGAQIGSTADRNAVSIGKPVTQLKPETSLGYEAAVSYRNNRVKMQFSAFRNNISDSISKQTLILPPGTVGQSLGGASIISQLASGAVFVDASSSPVLARANFGDARVYGFEHRLDWNLSPRWSLGTVSTYVRAADPATGLAPNIEGGTPAPDGYLRLRYNPARPRLWLETYLHGALRQERLSSLDLEDRRTGATRSRSNIASFFYNGATARGWVSAGADGKAGTADDRLMVSGETLSQIQDRVLGVGISSAPLYTALPGYLTLGFRGGFQLGERHSVSFALDNLADRNYRGISWGVDACGRSALLRYSYAF